MNYEHYLVLALGFIGLLWVMFDSLYLHSEQRWKVGSLKDFWITWLHFISWTFMMGAIGVLIFSLVQQTL